ncbi:MAG: class I SAM-dependent methyltransferase [Thermodesulfobacteriota bacterium]
MTSIEYLRGLQRSWNTYGQEDPLWAICVDPRKQHNRWDLDDFFALGRESVDGLMRWCAANRLPGRRGTCLDFGCGVGRLTQALASHFTKAVGVDIAPSMIEKARAYNRHGNRCEYAVNMAGGLPLFKDATFDLIYTEYVLQHMHPSLAVSYIREMVRVLRPGGALSFQLPSRLPSLVYPEGMAAAIGVDREDMVLRTSEPAVVRVAVTNTGQGTWDQDGSPRTPVRVCHHWVDMNTGATFMVHGHQTIGQRVEPGETALVDYAVHAPRALGHYVCVVDLVDFNGVLFSARGSMPATIECVVVPGPEAERGNAAADKAEAPARPNMEMHAIPEKDVALLLRDCGARLVGCVRSGDRPDEVRHSRYLITK